MMEVDGRTSHCNENRHSQSSTSLNEQKPADNSPSTSGFINHAAVEWEQSRRIWTGDVSQRSSHRMQTDPIISWSTTYDDLLSTNDPFPKPIPLPEMVDFLVDIWHDDGLFD